MLNIRQLHILIACLEWAALGLVYMQGQYLMAVAYMNARSRTTKIMVIFHYFLINDLSEEAKWQIYV